MCSINNPRATTAPASQQVATSNPTPSLPVQFVSRSRGLKLEPWPRWMAGNLYRSSRYLPLLRARVAHGVNYNEGKGSSYIDVSDFRDKGNEFLRLSDILEKRFLGNEINKSTYVIYVLRLIG